jgi:hypothetical protein
MQLDIVDYLKSQDSELLELFYKSTYHRKSEFEYFRFPERWIDRYLGEDSLIKIAKHKKKIIASLGLIIYDGRVNGKKNKIGFFIDNSIDPKYIHSHYEIFNALFNELEKDARIKGIKVIFGWDFVHKADKQKKLYTNRGYKQINGFYWYPIGTDINIKFNSKNENKINLLWKMALLVSRFNIFLNKLKHKSKTGIIISKIELKNIKEITKFLNKQNKNKQFSMIHTESSLSKILTDKIAHGWIAKKNNKIYAALLYFVGSWSGWIFGKPHYDKTNSYFFSYTPFEFVNLTQDKDIATSLLFKAMAEKQNYTPSHKGFTAFVDCFHDKINWRIEAIKKAGGNRAEFDHGCILVKNLSNQKINYNKNIYLPTLFVIAPVKRGHVKK